MPDTDAARRVTEFQDTLDPRVLWPGVTEAKFAAAMREIVRLASAALSPEPSPVDGAYPVLGGLPAFGAAAFASGLGPLLGYWVETGRLRAPADVAALLSSHLEHGRRRARRLRGELERVVVVLQAEEIPVTVLKGMHTGAVYFPEPGTRPASDIDLLIPSDRSAAAARVLEAAGFRPLYALPQRSTWAPRDNPPLASVVLTHADNPWTLDLHVSLDRQFPATTALARFDVREERDLTEWSAGPAGVRVLAQPLLTCYLAVHTTSHFPYISTLRLVELLLVLRRDGGTIAPWSAVADRLAATDATAFGYPALKLAADLLPGVVDTSMLADLRRGTPARIRAFTDRLTPATALQMYRYSFEGHFLWVGSRWRRITGFIRWLWPRDQDGRRQPVPQAVRITGRRLRRLASGLISWKHSPPS